MVIVAFLADWCPFCRAFEPEFARLTAAGPFRLQATDVSSEQNPLWGRFGIEVVPTVIVFQEGKAIFRADAIPGRGLARADIDAVVRAALSARAPAASRSTK